MGQQRTHGRVSRRHPLLTATAAATAAAALVSTMSSSSSPTGRIGPSLSLSPITPVAAFGVGPLHLSSSNANCDMVGRRSSSLPRDVGSTNTVVGVPSSPGQQSWGPQHGRSRRHCPPRPGDEQRFRDGGPPPPPLRMAVTDPETLLGAEELLVEELAEQLRQRTAAGAAAAAAASNGSGGATASPARRRGRPTKASGSSSSPSTSKSSLTSDSASIYFGLHRRQQQQTRRAGLLELDIDLGLDGNTNQGPGRSNGGRPSARLGFEVPSPLVQEGQKQPHTAPPQIIESDMEVLELGAISLVPQEDYVGGAEQILEHAQKEEDSNEDTSSAVNRSLRPVSSTPAQQRQSANARRSSKVAAPERKSTLALGRRKPATPQRKGRKSVTAARGKSKSSTMPGFLERNANLSGRRRAHRDGVRIAEEKSGKDLEKIVNTQSSSSARRRANSMAMYKGSASVPDSLVAYTKEIHDATQRITPAEEKELGAKTQEAIRLQNTYSSLEEELGREPTDEEWCAVSDGVDSVEELRATIDQGMEAKNQLVESNLRMVQGVVNTYIRNGLGSQYNAGDLMQEGTLALIRAAEKFEPERGFRFSTYAMYWIRSAVKSSQIVQSRVIQVPQRLHETHKRVQKVERGLKAELGRPPTNEELAKSSDLSELQLGRCKKAMAQKCVSLDATIQNKFKPGTGGNRKDTGLRTYVFPYRNAAKPVTHRIDTTRDVQLLANCQTAKREADTTPRYGRKHSKPAVTRNILYEATFVYYPQVQI